MLVAGGAAAGVAGNTGSQLLPIDLFKAVANFLCLRFPQLGVAGLLSHERVSDLVQYDLLDFFEGAVIYQVLTDCDSPCTKVALTCSSDRSVKAKAVVDERVLDEESVCKVDGLRLD